MLRPGGRLAPFHHVFQSPPEVTEASAKVYRRVAPDSPLNLSSQERRAPDRRRDPASGRVQRTGAVAVRLGVHLHQGRVAGPATHPRWHHSAPAGQAGGSAARRRGRDRCAGGQLHDVLHHGGGHGAANRRYLTASAGYLRERRACIRGGVSSRLTLHNVHYRRWTDTGEPTVRPGGLCPVSRNVSNLSHHVGRRLGHGGPKRQESRRFQLPLGYVSKPSGCYICRIWRQTGPSMRCKP